MLSQPRVVGKVEIRPGQGVSAPVLVSLVTVCLQRRESIHPGAEQLMRGTLGAPRKEITDIVGREMLLYRSPVGRENEAVYSFRMAEVAKK